MDKQSIPMIRSEAPIPFGERLTDAIQKYLTMQCNAQIAFCLAPVFFCRTLFTSKKEIHIPIPFVQPQMNINLGPQGDEEEEWMKEHKKMLENREQEEDSGD